MLSHASNSRDATSPLGPNWPRRLSREEVSVLESCDGQTRLRLVIEGWPLSRHIGLVRLVDLKAVGPRGPELSFLIELAIREQIRARHEFLRQQGHL